jgi:hypothetical protein
MAVSLVSLIMLCRREDRSFAVARRGRVQLDARHLLLVLSAGSVALWWFWARRPRSSPAPAFDLRSPMTPSRLDRRSTLDRPTDRAPPSAQPRKPSISSPPLDGGGSSSAWSVPARSTEMAAPWVQRAALAIHLVRPAALRRIAEEMERADLAIEAGLLKNYALLLERSSSSRDRVLAEVTRMLQAATAHRRILPHASSRRGAASVHEPPPSRAVSPQAAVPVLPSWAAPPPRSTESMPDDSRAPPNASSRPLVPLPVLPVERRRRAAR